MLAHRHPTLNFPLRLFAGRWTNDICHFQFIRNLGWQLARCIYLCVRWRSVLCRWCITWMCQKTHLFSLINTWSYEYKPICNTAACHSQQTLNSAYLFHLNAILEDGSLDETLYACFARKVYFYWLNLYKAELSNISIYVNSHSFGALAWSQFI